MDELPIPGAWAHYDATEGLELDDAGRVEQWSDLSGNGHHVTCGTDTRRPRTGTRKWKGRNVVVFDGIDDVMRSPAPLTQPRPFTIFAAFKCDALPSPNGSIPFSLGNNGPELYVPYPASVFNLWAAANVDLGAFNTDPHIFAGVFDGTASHGWLEDTPSATGGASFEPGLTGGSNEVIAIGGFAGGGYPLAGWVGALAIYTSVLSPAAITATQRHFGERWRRPPAMPGGGRVRARA